MRARNIGLVGVMARMPPDDKQLLEAKAIENVTSANAELIRCIRVRREAEQSRSA